MRKMKVDKCLKCSKLFMTRNVMNNVFTQTFHKVLLTLLQRLIHNDNLKKTQLITSYICTVCVIK